VVTSRSTSASYSAIGLVQPGGPVSCPRVAAVPGVAATGSEGEGVPLPERGDWAGALPDRIRIFRLPLVESFPDPAELEEEIRITVLHEVAHYFGLDEDRLDDLGFS